MGWLGKPNGMCIGFNDVKALRNLGVVEQDDTGVFVPFDRIHTDFTLSREAA